MVPRPGLPNLPEQKRLPPAARDVARVPLNEDGRELEAPPERGGLDRPRGRQ